MTDDEEEAKNAKYNCCRIVLLTSGAFALFMPFSNDEGMPLEHVGTIEEIIPKILTAAECDTFHERAQARQDKLRFSTPRPTSKPKTTSSLEDLL